MSEQYPSDLTDGQWQVLRGLLPQQAKRGRRPICRRLILNAILYVNRTGCQWRALPHDFPKWKTVYTIFWRWRRDGIWRLIPWDWCGRWSCMAPIGKIMTELVLCFRSSGSLAA